jgi:threonine dehydrogenase-like Zn-dependent dehydrogenase
MVEFSRRGGDGGFSAIDPSRGVVFGHEICAEILDYGPGSVRPIPIGARVVSIPVITAPTGMETIGYSNTYPGGYAERMLLAEELLLPVPDGLSNQQAAMTEPFAVGAHAVARAAIDKPSAAVVVGCGPVGLAVIASLKARGYGPVAASDFSPARRRMAERLGADLIIDPAVESPHTKWSEMGVGSLATLKVLTSGQAMKRAIIFECVGVPGLLQALIEACPNGSQIIVAGVCMETDTIEPFLAVIKQIDIRFVVGFTPEEFSRSLKDIADGRIDAGSIITDVVGLDGVADAFQRLSDPHSQVKIAIEPSQPA